MAKNILWSPENKSSKLQDFKEKNKHNIFDDSYNSLHNWSVKNKKEFWSSIWDYTEIKGVKKNPILENENDFINSIFLLEWLSFSQSLYISLFHHQLSMHLIQMKHGLAHKEFLHS